MTTRRALVCAPLLPEFDRESGSRRLHHLVEFLGETGWHVTYVAERRQGEQRYIQHLQQRGVAVYEGPPKEMADLIRLGGFDLAIVAFWHLAEAYLPIIRQVSPSTRIVVDTIDLHFVRNARRTLRPDETSGVPGQLDVAHADEIVRELNVYAAADGVLTVSQKEADLIADLTNNTQLAHAVPDAEDLTPSAVPFGERRGILFLGNFRHPPNLEGLEFLCRQVLPHLDEAVLRAHPLYVVGNALDDRVRRVARDSRRMRLVGWVPSVTPYLERARITVIPMLHGAGTKRKLLQALMSGTPAVSTTIGAEGLGVRDGEHLLVADDPVAFAAAMARLLREKVLWTTLRKAAQEHVTARHAREPVRRQLKQVVDLVLSRVALTQARSPENSELGRPYAQLVREVSEAVGRYTPERATVLMVSRGDEDLLKLGSRRGWHFPQTETGEYAGAYPADADAAIAHLEQLRAKGAEYLVVPNTGLWWLDYYAGLRAHLEDRYVVSFRDDARCVIFALATTAARRPSRTTVPPRGAVSTGA